MGEKEKPGLRLYLRCFLGCLILMGEGGGRGLVGVGRMRNFLESKKGLLTFDTFVKVP